MQTLPAWSPLQCPELGLWPLLFHNSEGLCSNTVNSTATKSVLQISTVKKEPSGLCSGLTQVRSIKLYVCSVSLKGLVSPGHRNQTWPPTDTPSLHTHKYHRWLLGGMGLECVSIHYRGPGEISQNNTDVGLSPQWEWRWDLRPVGGLSVGIPWRVPCPDNSQGSRHEGGWVSRAGLKLVIFNLATPCQESVDFHWIGHIFLCILV